MLGVNAMFYLNAYSIYLHLLIQNLQRLAIIHLMSFGWTGTVADFFDFFSFVIFNWQVGFVNKWVNACSLQPDLGAL